MFNRAISKDSKEQFGDIKASLTRTQSLLTYLVQQQLYCKSSDLRAVEQMEDTLTKIDKFLEEFTNR